MKIAYLTVLLMLSSSLVMAADNKNTTQNSEAKNQVEAVNSFKSALNIIILRAIMML